MNRMIEDMLCGILGYGIGSSTSKRREITQEEAESLIRSFLSQVPLDDVIDYWIEANNPNEWERMRIVNTLRYKASQIV